MKRDMVNFIVGLMSFIVLVALMSSGVIIALPHEHGPGEKRILGIGRGEWGDIHLWLGVTFVVLMVVHIILHWSWVKTYFKAMFGHSEN
jgi:hypothetical protein